MGDKIRTIAHLSDIHIRKLHRLVEYRQVFQRLYGKLKQLKPDLIFVGGDIVLVIVVHVGAGMSRGSGHL